MALTPRKREPHRFFCHEIVTKVGNHNISIVWEVGPYVNSHKGKGTAIYPLFGKSGLTEMWGELYEKCKADDAQKLSACSHSRSRGFFFRIFVI